MGFQYRKQEPRANWIWSNRRVGSRGAIRYAISFSPSSRRSTQANFASSSKSSLKLHDCDARELEWCAPEVSVRADVLTAVITDKGNRQRQTKWNFSRVVVCKANAIFEQKQSNTIKWVWNCAEWEVGRRQSKGFQIGFQLQSIHVRLYTLWWISLMLLSNSIFSFRLIRYGLVLERFHEGFIGGSFRVIKGCSIILTSSTDKPIHKSTKRKSCTFFPSRFQ